MAIRYLDSDVRIGFHVSKASTLVETFEAYAATPLRAYQLYVGQSRGWRSPTVDVSDLRQARRHLNRRDHTADVHGSLIFNIAGASGGPSAHNYRSNVANTKRGMVEELDLATALGGRLVVHCGANSDYANGVATAGQVLAHALTATGEHTQKIARELGISTEDFIASRVVALENAAGERNKLGSTLEGIQELRESVGSGLRDRVKVCIDTAHAFGAGQYRLGDLDEVGRFYDDFDRIIGLEHLALIHLNDSLAAFGSGRDRHEVLGFGHQFSDVYSTGGQLDGLRAIVERSREHGTALIGEPPGLQLDGGYFSGGMASYAVLRGECGVDPDLPRYDLDREICERHGRRVQEFEC